MYGSTPTFGVQFWVKKVRHTRVDTVLRGLKSYSKSLRRNSPFHQWENLPEVAFSLLSQTE